MRLLRPIVPAFVALVIAGSSAVAEDAKPGEAKPAAKVSFYRDVRPIIQDRCQGCHQPAKAQGGLVMTGYAAIKKGGESESPGFVPGDPDTSEVVSQITAVGDQPPAMPKGGPPLKPDQIELLRRWVAEGAADDTPEITETAVDMAHPPVYTLPPVLTSLDYSPDGSLLAVSGYHEVLLHQVDGSGVVARLVGLSERIESARFSPDGKRLAVTGGSPGRFGEVQIWDVAARELKQSVLVTYDTVYGASWSTDGTKVAFGCADNTCRAIDAGTGKQVFFQGAHNDWVLDTVFSVDSSHLVSVSRDRSMKLNEVATERFVDNVTSITPGALKGGLISVDRHPKKDELLVGGADGTPKIYQMHRTKARVIGDDFNLIRAFDAMPGRLFSVRYNADGSRILAGSSSDGQGEVRVYQEADAKLVSRFASENGAIYAVAYRPDGKQVATAGFDGMVRLWDPETGKLVKEFLPVPAEPASVAQAAK
ncbi:MAG: PD40 domain-containing protein [Planctomycetia bacterium]|nr:PD40 domain-containing protein [Planctomycetia bacterium]